MSQLDRVAVKLFFNEALAKKSISPNDENKKH